MQKLSVYVQNLRWIPVLSTQSTTKKFMKRLLGISHHTIFFTQYYTNVFFFSVETLYYLCQFFSAPKFLRKIETLEDDDLHLSPHPRSFFFLASAFFMSLSLGGEVAPSMLLRYRAHFFGGARIYPTWVSIFWGSAKSGLRSPIWQFPLDFGYP